MTNGASAQSANPPAYAWLASAGPVTQSFNIENQPARTVGLNSHHAVVGSKLMANGSHAFLYQGSLPQTDLGVLPGGLGSLALAINDTGWIVGSSYISDMTHRHAVLWQQTNGTMTASDLGTLPSFSYQSEAYGINARGLIVGDSQALNGSAHAALWQPGASPSVADLGTLSSQISVGSTIPPANGLLSTATGINAAGQVGGWSLTGDPSLKVVHAAQWQQQNGQWRVTDLGTLGGSSNAPVGQSGSPGNLTFSTVLAINNATSAQMVGHSVTAQGNLHATLWQDNKITDLGTLGNGTTPANGTQSVAYAINDSGAIVGNSTYTAGAALTHAVLWKDGKIYDLNNFLPAGTTGWVLTSADGIANDGTITGIGTLYGQQTAFLLKVSIPTPPASVLHSFSSNSSDGQGPTSGLIQGSDGNFYGTTFGGGKNNSGAVFQINSSGKETLLYSFGSETADFGGGSSPTGDLVQGSDGNFYGTTLTGGAQVGIFGCGTAFKITPSGQKTVLHAFGAPRSDGCYPVGGLIQGSDGNFYGTTSDGASGGGTVFKITPSGEETVLYSFKSGFDEVDASTPNAGLIQGSDGSFYGTTAFGGTNQKSALGQGTVFKITPSEAEVVIHSFGGAGDGVRPEARLLRGSDSYLYGTTSEGGKYGAGTVFRIDSFGLETIMHSFGAPGDGATPNTGLIQASDGNFYGTTSKGGKYGKGTVFAIAPYGTEATLYSFGESSGDGNQPLSLIQGSDGNFYGTTSAGGVSGNGTVFSLKKEVLLGHLH
jgi:uncharacterized repeat protein (TIGR03803 family)/probable HAF family extracellular repeat protein